MMKLMKVANGQKRIPVRTTNLASQVTLLWPKLWGFFMVLNSEQQNIILTWHDLGGYIKVK